LSHADARMTDLDFAGSKAPRSLMLRKDNRSSSWERNVFVTDKAILTRGSRRG
jgi:hypothetical protein